MKGIVTLFGRVCERTTSLIRNSSPWATGLCASAKSIIFDRTLLLLIFFHIYIIEFFQSTYSVLTYVIHIYLYTSPLLRSKKKSIIILKKIVYIIQNMNTFIPRFCACVLTNIFPTILVCTHTHSRRRTHSGSFFLPELVITGSPVIIQTTVPV